MTKSEFTAYTTRRVTISITAEFPHDVREAQAISLKDIVDVRERLRLFMSNSAVFQTGYCTVASGTLEDALWTVKFIATWNTTATVSRHDMPTLVMLASAHSAAEAFFHNDELLGNVHWFTNYNVSDTQN